MRKWLMAGLVVLAMLVPASAQLNVRGGMTTAKGGHTFGRRTPPVDAFSSCRLASVTGRTVISACGTYAGGNYYLDRNIDGDGTCIAVNGSTPAFNLAMQGYTITYGNDPNAATNVLMNTLATVASTPFMRLARPNVSGDGEMAAVTGISNTIKCDTDANGTYETTYNKGVNYGIAYDSNTGRYGLDGNNKEGLIWLSGKPAVGTVCQIPDHQFTYPRYGILNSNGNTYLQSTGNTLNGGAGLTVSCGTITASTTATPTPYSMPLFNAGKSTPNLSDLYLNSKGWSAPALGLSFSAGATIARLHLTQDATSGNIFYRDYLEGSVLWNFNNQTSPTTGNTIHDVTIDGGMHGGIAAFQQNSIIYNNTIQNLTSRFTNDFAIHIWGTNIEAYGNTIDCYDPANANISCRGIGVEANTVNVHDNTIEVHEATNNAEYGGCEAGGAYALQIEHNNRSGSTYNNSLTAYARNCDANGMRVGGGSQTAVTTAVSSNENIRAYRKDNTVTTEATGVMTRGARGWELRDSTIEADTYIVSDLTQDGAPDPPTDATFRRVVFKKGPTPAAGFHTWYPRNYQPSSGLTELNWYCIDCTTANGASLTDVIAFKIGETGNQYKPYHLWIKWAVTFNVKVGGVNQSGFLVTATDVASGTYSGTTDSNGNVTLELPQYHIYNTAGTAVNTATLNPYSIAATKAGCTTANLAGQSYTTTGTTVNLTTTCP